MSNQYLVIGVGRFGSAVAKTLFDLGHEVVAVDRDEEELDTVIGDVTHAAVLDATDESPPVLRHLCLRSKILIKRRIGPIAEPSRNMTRSSLIRS